MRIEKLTTDAETLRELGRRLARLRKERRLAQDELAQSAGIGVATLRRIESGQDAQLGTWVKLLKALEMTAAIDGLVPERYESPMAEVRRTARRSPGRSADGRVHWGDEDT